MELKNCQFGSVNYNILMTNKFYSVLMGYLGSLGNSTKLITPIYASELPLLFPPLEWRNLLAVSFPYPASLPLLGQCYNLRFSTYFFPVKAEEEHFLFPVWEICKPYVINFLLASRLWSSWGVNGEQNNQYLRSRPRLITLRWMWLRLSSKQLHRVFAFVI